MTIALVVKVHDGLILAADSASTLSEAGGGVVNIYNNANKIANLRKGLPIGALTFGNGSVGNASISTLFKDLRQLLSSDDPAWQLDPATYSVAEVADKAKQFLFDDTWMREYPTGSNPPQSPLGVVIAGYGAVQALPEVYFLQIEGHQCTGPDLFQQQSEVGVAMFAQQEAIHRVIFGYGMEMGAVLENDLGVPAANVPQVLQAMQDKLGRTLAQAAMPLQDAIDLARFLVHLQIEFGRFTPGAPTVGGPIEVAAITKHEGYKWVDRKHYYSPHLNQGNEP